MNINVNACIKIIFYGLIIYETSEGLKLYTKQLRIAKGTNKDETIFVVNIYLVI